MPDPECTGQLIDGIWHGCGCPDCREEEAEAIEHEVEAGHITETEALERHALNGD